MSELTLVSQEGVSIRPLIEAALSGQERVLLSGIYRTEQRLRELEQQARMDSVTFQQRYSAGTIEETLESIEWIGELRTLQRLREKLDLLRGISIRGN